MCLQLHTELENIISGKKPVTVAPQKTPSQAPSTLTGEDTTKSDKKESQEDGELVSTESEEFKTLKAELK